MNIGIRLHDVAGNALEDRLDAAKAQGFSCAHVAMQKVLPGFRMEDAPKLLTKELAEEVRAAFAKRDMSCAVLGCYLNLATPDEEAYQRTLEIYYAHLRFARWIGAGVVGTETGAPNTAYRTEPACWTAASLDLFIHRVLPVVNRAEDEGAILAIEPVCRHIVSTPERAARVLRALNSPSLQIILDTVNLLTPENCSQCDALIDRSEELFGDRIRVLHMKDYRVEPGREDVRSMACGTGVMDYTRLLRLAHSHPGIPMTLEDTVPANAEAARLTLENWPIS
ncbi:MAG: sugar phosphate isomerase/epimerase [Clostridia bacterium]|nr:sugar phosphate isomerase/epimerase [Clostridia bacterium]